MRWVSFGAANETLPRCQLNRIFKIIIIIKSLNLQQLKVRYAPSLKKLFLIQFNLLFEQLKKGQRNRRALQRM